MPKLTETSKASVEDELHEAFPQHSSFVDALTERLQKKTRRSRLFVMRISDAEHAALNRAARDAGVSASDVIRYAVSLCLVDGVLDPVAKKHLATVAKVSKADRHDVRQSRKELRATTDEDLEVKVSIELGMPLKEPESIPTIIAEDDGEVLVDDIYEEV